MIELTKSLRGGAVAAISLALAAVLSAPLPAHAAMKSMHSKPMHGKMMASKGIYVCTKCREYYSAAAAKKMHYKDGMGHKLTKVSKAPAGYANGAKAGSMGAM